MAKIDSKKQAGGKPDGNIATPKSAAANEEMTVEKLTEQFPVLVKQIKNDMANFIADRTADEIKRQMPELYQRIVKDAAGASVANLNEKGFLLSQADPYAEGSLRTYMSLKKLSGLRLPYVLPFKDKKTADAIRGYIIRAEGGGDIERAKAARAALEKCQ